MPETLKEEVAQNTDQNKKGGCWLWSILGCSGLFGLFLLIGVVGSQVSQNQAQSIFELGKTDKDAQLDQISEASDPVLDALEELAPGLVAKERKRRQAAEKVAAVEAKKKKVEAEAKAESEKNKEAEGEYRKILTREVKSMRAKPKMEVADEAKQDQIYVTVNGALLGARVQWLAEAPEKLSPETQKLEQEYIKLHTAYQVDALPRLRKIQVKIWREKLWQNDIEVRASGSRFDRVTFTAGMFAANKNKQTAHDAALESLELLRFKRDTYEWYRGSKSSYWDLEPLADDVLATIDSNGDWEPLER